MDGLIGFLVIGGLVGWYIKQKKESQSTTVKTSDTPRQSHEVKRAGSGQLKARTNSTNEERIAALHREATEYKGKDWNRAISCLREADSLVHTVKTVYPIKHFLRLPLFLQQAGNFSLAMQEFNRLLDQTDERTAQTFPHQTKGVCKMLAHADYTEIYSAMHTACQREKQLEQAEEYKRLSDEHKEKHRKMLKAQMAKDEKKMAERRRARS